MRREIWLVALACGILFAGAADAAAPQMKDPNKFKNYRERQTAVDGCGQFNSIIFCSDLIDWQDSSFAYQHRGMGYATQKDYDKALADFDRAIELDAKNGEAFYNRSLAKRAKGDSAGADSDIATMGTIKEERAEDLYNSGFQNLTDPLCETLRLLSDASFDRDPTWKPAAFSTLPKRNLAVVPEKTCTLSTGTVTCGIAKEAMVNGSDAEQAAFGARALQVQNTAQALVGRMAACFTAAWEGKEGGTPAEKNISGGVSARTHVTWSLKGGVVGPRFIVEIFLDTSMDANQAISASSEALLNVYEK